MLISDQSLKSSFTDAAFARPMDDSVHGPFLDGWAVTCFRGVLIFLTSSWRQTSRVIENKEEVHVLEAKVAITNCERQKSSFNKLLLYVYVHWLTEGVHSSAFIEIAKRSLKWIARNSLFIRCIVPNSHLQCSGIVSMQLRRNYVQFFTDCCDKVWMNQFKIVWCLIVAP